MPRVDHRLRVPPAISAEVIARYGNDCWLDMPGCTRVGDTSDHIVPYVFGGPTIPANLRRACRKCNGLRRERILSGWPSVIHAVIGPPCGGKSTWVMEHRQEGDVVVDMDMLAGALTGGDGHDAPDWAREMASAAWYGAYRKATMLAEPVNVWIIKTLPATPRSPRMLDEWLALDYDVHVCDPGKHEVLRRHGERGAGARELAGVRQWYRTGITQAGIDSRQKARRARLAALGLRKGEGREPDASPPPSSASRPRW